MYIPDPTKGRPLFNGQIYVGEPDLDPQVAINQKQLNVIEEDGTVVAVPQPFLLSAGGTPVYNGNPVRLDVSGNYSIKILDKLGVQVYYIENAFAESVNKSAIFNDVEGMVTSTDVILSSEGAIINVAINNKDTNMGGAIYKVLSAAQYALESPVSTPDGELISGLYLGSDFYLLGGTEYIAKRLQDGPDVDVYQFGYRGIGVIDNGPNVKATPDPTKDESDCLDKVFTYIERGSPQDIGASNAGTTEFIQKGRYNVIFPARTICNISRPLPYFINRCNVYFNNTDVRPITPMVVYSSFGFNNVCSQLLINYEIFNTDEEIYDAHLAGNDANGIEIMQFGEASIAFPLESFTVYDHCIITGGWEGIKGAREGILFGIHFNNCRMVNPLSWGINIGDNTQISTTCLITQPFVRLTKRDTVKHNGFVWRALQHMGALASQEPPATAVSSEYWQIGLDSNGDPEAVGSQDAWVTGKFYRAFGKHYRLINQSTLTMTNPSGDGGTDVSPTFEFSGVNLDIDHFQLEKHQKVFSDRPTFSVISGALTFGTLYLAECQITNEGNSTVQVGGLAFSCRVAHTSTADNEPLNGPNWFDYWDKTGFAASENAWALTTDYTTGDATFVKAANAGGRGISIDSLEQKGTAIKRGRIIAIDGENTNEGRVITGKGISRGLMKNMRGQQSLRGVVTPKTQVVPVLSVVSVFTHRPRPEQNGTLFTTSLSPGGVMTVEIDGNAPTGTKYGFQVSETTGGIANPSGDINLIGINNAFFLNETTVTNGTIWAEKTGPNEDGTSPNSWRTWVDSDASGGGTSDSTLDRPKNVTGVTNYVVVADDLGRTLYTQDATATGIALPTDDSIIPINGMIIFAQEGAGTATINASNGATLNGVTNGSGSLTQYAGVTIVKRAANTYTALMLKVV